MALSHSPSLVMNNLVLCLDAGNSKSILSAVEVLVVAGGGGGGGSTAGGGGAGGLIYSSSHSITPGSSITTTVGAGGQGTVRSNQGAPTNTSGGNSVFGALTAIGGGRGYSGSNTFTPRTSAVGGSGGGGGYFSGGLDPKGSGTSSAGTAGQGFAGGDGAAISEWGGGGGGGAGGAGGAQVASNSLRTGGPGLGFNISGTLQYYGGGGGGGCFLNGFSLGGIGGGGNGGDGNSHIPTVGTTNTGGGGGGGGYYQHGPGGGAGGSGIVIVRYPGSQRASGGTVTFVAGHTIHTFTTSGTFTPNFGDMSGNGNTGTLVNGVGYNSDNGGALSFDGVNDRVDCGTFSVPFLTVSTWVYKTTSTTNQGICRKNNGWAVSQYNGTLQVAPGTSWTFYNTGYTIPLNTWVNIVYTYSGTGAAGSQTVYINGSSIYSTSAGSGAISANANQVRVGFDDNNWFWNGRISNTTIYNRALTAQEIQQNFNALRSRYSI